MITMDSNLAALHRQALQRQARQRTQNELDIVGRDTPTHAHMAGLQPQMQGFVARRH